MLYHLLMVLFLFISIKLVQLRYKVNTKLINVDSWLWLNNNLSLCYSKSVFMLAKSLNNSTKLPETSLFQIKIIGMYFQRMACVNISRLYSIRQYVRLIFSNAKNQNQLEHLMCHIKSKFLIISCLKNAIFSLVHCHSKYCFVPWGTASNSFLQSMEEMHTIIIRTANLKNFDAIFRFCRNLISFYENVHCRY